MDISEQVGDRFGRGVAISDQVGDRGLVCVWIYLKRCVTGLVGV